MFQHFHLKEFYGWTENKIQLFRMFYWQWRCSLKKKTETRKDRKTQREKGEMKKRQKKKRHPGDVEYSVWFIYVDIASIFSLLLMLMGRKLENFNFNPLRLATEITSHKIAKQIKNANRCTLCGNWGKRSK